MPSNLALEHLQLAYQHINESIALVDENGKWLYGNQHCQLWLSQFNLTTHPTQFEDLQPQIDQKPVVFEQIRHTNWQGELSLLTESGGLPVLVKVNQVSQVQGLHCYLLQIEPLTEQSSNGTMLAQLAYKDGLTGLANRSLFNQLFDHEISQSQRLGLKFAMLFIDLDKFKQVNDSLGHDAGDLVLCTIASRLESSLRKSDVVARLGGDEFAVILNNVKDSDTVARVTEKLIREIKKPIKSGANIMQVGCSIGISVYPDNGEHAEALIQHADAAMYRAKHQSDSHYYYFSDALNRELQDMRLVEQQVLKGIEEQQFIPHFQPQIDVRSGHLIGIECLARWQHPQRGLLTAMEFIPVAVKLGVIQQVLELVLDQAFGSLREWHEVLEKPIPLSINIASNQFYQQQTFDAISSLLAAHQLQANAIRLEVTESTLQASGKDLVDRLKQVNMAGCSITLDEFGTGYSSLRYLQQLPVDTLKIDRSFVRNLDNNPHDKIIVKAIIQLAQTLGIEAIAEGVENQAQLEFLRLNDCHLMQGFLFSQAISGEDFSRYLSISPSRLINMV